MKLLSDTLFIRTLPKVCVIIVIAVRLPTGRLNLVTGGEMKTGLDPHFISKKPEQENSLSLSATL